MANTGGKGAQDTAQGFINDLGDNEKSALAAARKFVDTVNDAFPDISEDGPRRKIIDAAFRMSEQLVDVGNKLALSVVDLTQSTMEAAKEQGGTAKK